MLMLKAEIPKEPAEVGIPAHMRQQHLLGSGVPGEGQSFVLVKAGKW